MKRLSVDFDLSGVRLPPKDALGRAVATVEHWHPYERKEWRDPRYIKTTTGERLVKEHYFARTSDPVSGETIWINDDRWNPVRHLRKGAKNTFNVAEGRSGAIFDHRDTETSRYFVTYLKPGQKFLSASTNIPRGYYERWKPMSRIPYNNVTEAWYAPNVPHFRRLAKSAWDSQTASGTRITPLVWNPPRPSSSTCRTFEGRGSGSRR